MSASAELLAVHFDKRLGGKVPTAVARHDLNPVRFERPVTRPVSVSIVSVPAVRRWSGLRPAEPRMTAPAYVSSGSVTDPFPTKFFGYQVAVGFHP